MNCYDDDFIFKQAEGSKEAEQFLHAKYEARRREAEKLGKPFKEPTMFKIDNKENKTNNKVSISCMNWSMDSRMICALFR